jgi:hypothetical protein
MRLVDDSAAAWFMRKKTAGFPRPFEVEAKTIT